MFKKILSLLIINLFSMDLSCAIVKLTPIAPQKNIIEKEENTINQKASVNIPNKHSLPSVEKLLKVFVISNIKAKQKLGSTELLNNYYFSRGEFDKVVINIENNHNQLGMLFFSNNHDVINSLNETMIPPDINKDTKLRLRFMIAMLRKDTNKAGFVYNIHNDSNTEGNSLFWDIAGYVLYDIKPATKIFIEDLGVNEIGILSLKKSFDILNWEEIENFDINIINKISLAVLNDSPNDFKLKTMEEFGLNISLEKAYKTIGEELNKKGLEYGSDSTKQLPRTLKRALIYKQISVTEKQEDQLELISEFINVARKDNLMHICSIVENFAIQFTANDDTGWIAPDFVRIFACSGNKNMMLTWLNYLRENAPTDWIKVSAYDVFSYNKSLVSKQKIEEWLNSAINSMKLEGNNDSKIAFLKGITNSLLLGSNINNDGSINNFQEKLLNSINSIDNGMKENDLDNVFVAILTLRDLGLHDYIPALSLEMLVNYGV